MYSVAQFAKQVGVSVKTLQRWDREGRLKAKRTLSGRRYYNEADLATALNLPQRPAARRTLAYCRGWTTGLWRSVGVSILSANGFWLSWMPLWQEKWSVCSLLTRIGWRALALL